MSASKTRADIKVAYPELRVGGCTLQVVEFSDSFAIEVVIEESDNNSEMNRDLVRRVIQLARAMRLSGEYPRLASVDERVVTNFNCMGSANSMTNYRGGAPVYWVHWGTDHGTLEYRLVKALYVDAIERVRGGTR